MTRTIAEVKAAFEARFKQVVADGSSASFAPNGRRYMKHFAGTPDFKGGSQKINVFAEPPVETWFQEALAAAKLPLEDDGTKVAVLFWRIAPHVIEVSGGVTVMACYAFGDEPYVMTEPPA